MAHTDRALVTPERLDEINRQQNASPNLLSAARNRNRATVFWVRLGLERLSFGQNAEIQLPRSLSAI